VWPVLKLSSRAALWRTTADPPEAGLPVLLGFALLLIAARVGFEFFGTGAARHFNPYGINSVIAWLALELAVAALLVPAGRRMTALSSMFALSLIAELAIDAATIRFPAAAAMADPSWRGVAVPLVIFAAAAVWWIGAMAAVLRSLAPRSRLAAVGRVAALLIGLLLADAALPRSPVFLPPDFDARNANLWEFLHAGGAQLLAERAHLIRIKDMQASLLEAEVAQLAPQRKGITDVYALGIAGWGEQDVFIKELDGALQSVAGVLPIKDHVLRLINNRDTVEIVPLATVRNFTAAIHALGAVMDKSEDVLVLLMTSHGDKDGLALQLPGGVIDLTPQEVAAALDGEGIKNRVVIVSACYSGTFVAPLANDDTVVVTAADADHTSFGCAPERDWTYFGDAFFRQSLHPGSDFENAYNHARILIQGWELMDHLPPSNPQGSFGPALVAKLAPYFATNPGQ
jgi:hypothetical protein